VHYAADAYGLFVLGVGALDRRHIMCITACDEVEPMHKSPTIFRELVEICDPTLLTAELLGIPSMPNETEPSSAISACCHGGLRLPFLLQSRRREAQAISSSKRILVATARACSRSERETMDIKNAGQRHILRFDVIHRNTLMRRAATPRETLPLPGQLMLPPGRTRHTPCVETPAFGAT
jgi:hypothetical protein